MAFFGRVPTPFSNDIHEEKLVHTFAFWQLPLPELPELLNDEESVGAANFWQLPMPTLVDSSDDEAYVKACSPLSTVTLIPKPCSSDAVATSEVTSLQEDTLAAGVADDANVTLGEAAEEAPVVKTAKRRSKVEEMTAMLDDYAFQRNSLEANLRELTELQERLQRLTEQASACPAPGRDGASGSSNNAVGRKFEDLRAGFLPSEVAGRMLWFMSVSDLGRCSWVCREWKRLARSSDRWRSLCEVDWGLCGCGTWVEYRQRLERWRLLEHTLADLAGTRVPSGTFGSLARRRIFDSLRFLSELGLARGSDARYPARVSALLRATKAGGTLLSLLDDESPYLLCLAVRCLADLAAEESERPDLRTAVVARGDLVRSLLEGEDEEVVESSARMMLNLHGSAPGVPILARPPSLQPEAVSLDLVAACDPMQAAFAPWVGAWSGEMRYARGGERHSILRLVLGPEGDPTVDEARSVFRAAHDLRRNGETDSDFSRGIGVSSAPNGPPRLRSEGSAEYWHYFGFLANSDFDSAAEYTRYVDEQLERRRHAGNSPSSQRSAKNRCVTSKLVGAGWDDQNGSFTLEAPLPNILPRMPEKSLPYTPQASSKSPSSGPSMRMPTSPTSSAFKGVTTVIEPTVPLHMVLKYDGRGSSYELTGFLAEGTPSFELSASGCLTTPVLYGVWATAPSQHRHLFALQRVGPLYGV